MRMVLLKNLALHQALIIDYLALLGDKSDNIPGAPGVGEKTAVSLLTAFGGIDSIFDNLKAIPELTIRAQSLCPPSLKKIGRW